MKPFLKPDALDRFVARAIWRTIKIAATILVAPFVLVAAVLTAKATTKAFGRWVRGED